MFLIKRLPSQPIVIKTLILNVSFIPIQIVTAFWRFHPPKASGIHFIRRLLCFPFLIPTDWSVFFFFMCWLGMRVLPSVARGLPDWLDSFRGKRAECFWALEFECETLGDAVVFPAKNTHFEEFAHSRKSTKSDFFLPVLRGSVSQKCKAAVCWCYCSGPGDTSAKLHRKNLETASSKYRWGNSFDCVREDSVQ